MKPYKCIIIEDEPIAAEILRDYISEVSFLNLVGVHSNALTALDFLKDNSVDLIFLDINLPKLKGLDFLKSLKNPPAVIITTAYEEYALKGYEFNVLDYLLKPIEFSRFLQAVNKLEFKSVNPFFVEESKELFMQLSINKKLVRVNLSEILFIESKREYLHIQTIEKEIICKMQISEIEKILDALKFIRIHRSFIVAKDKVDVISLTELEVKGVKLPVGRSYRKLVAGSW
jgi:DNA-binding LytR/AlgR family response regulator